MQVCFSPKLSHFHHKARDWFWAGAQISAPCHFWNCNSNVLTSHYWPIWLLTVHHILPIRCSGTGFYKQATRSSRHIWKKKNKVTFDDRNTIYLCLEVVASIKFNYFPCGFKSRAASVKFNYFPLRFTWQRCHCYLPSASGQRKSLGMICSIIPMPFLLILLSPSTQHFCGHVIHEICLWYHENYSISSTQLTAEIWRGKKEVLINFNLNIAWIYFPTLLDKCLVFVTQQHVRGMCHPHKDALA